MCFVILNSLLCHQIIHTMQADSLAFWMFCIYCHQYSLHLHSCCISLTLCSPDYPVQSFDGRKKVVFSNVSWMGGKNDFLGIAYLVIGSLCIVMSIVMLIVYAKFKFPEEEWIPVQHFFLNHMVGSEFSAKVKGKHFKLIKLNSYKLSWTWSMSLQV